MSEERLIMCMYRWMGKSRPSTHITSMYQLEHVVDRPYEHDRVVGIRSAQDLL